MKKKLEAEFLDTMSKDPANWKGLFYYNRRDPRLIVPKIYSSMGWTINFASIYSYILLVCIVLIIIASKYLL